MEKPVILFIQGGGTGAYKADRQLAAFLQDAFREKYVIHYPAMPGENEPSYENYKAEIAAALQAIHTKVILVGHSLGACFLLKYLSEQETDKEIAGLFLIATPYWGEGGWQYEGFRLENNFASKLPKMPVFLYHGTADEVVPFAHLALYAEKIPRAKVYKITGRGHQLNNELSEVVRDIKSLGV